MTSTNSLDNLLVEIGDFGKYQIFTFSLVCFAVVLHSSVHIAYVFTAKDVSYRCKIPGCDSENIDEIQYKPGWIKNAVPYTKEKNPSKCEMYPRIRSNISKEECYDRNNFLEDTETCSTFVFADKTYSIVKEYDIYCQNNEWKLAMVGTINNIGQFFGLLVSGIVSDRFGRRFVLVWGMVLCAICGLIKTLAPTYEWFLVFEFWDAFFGSGTYTCGFIMGVELVAPKKRVLTGAISSSCYAIGEVFTATAAWLVNSNWKQLTYILYIPPLALLSFFWLLPEGVRWNLSKGNVEEAKKTLRKVANINGKTLSEHSLDKVNILQSDEKLNESTNNFWDILKSTPLMVRFVSCCICWITCAFLFYGLTLTAATLSNNAYLDFIMSSLVEIPAYVSCSYFVNKIGRKWSLFVSYIMTSLACLTYIFINPDDYILHLVIFLLAKFFATAAFTIIYIITSEIFPTCLRHTMMGSCSMIGRIGSMISPQVSLLKHIWVPLPLILFSSLGGLSAFLTIFFPETLNVNLPSTIEEAENIGKPKEKSSDKS